MDLYSPFSPAVSDWPDWAEERSQSGDKHLMLPVKKALEVNS